MSRTRPAMQEKKYDRRDLALPGNRQIALQRTNDPSIHLLTARNAEDDKELDAAATECRQMKP